MYINLYKSVLKYTGIYKLKNKSKKYISDNFSTNFIQINSKALYFIEKNLEKIKWSLFVYNKNGLYIFEKNLDNLNWEAIYKHAIMNDEYKNFMKINAIKYKKNDNIIDRYNETLNAIKYKIPYLKNYIELIFKNPYYISLCSFNHINWIYKWPSYYNTHIIPEASIVINTINFIENTNSEIFSNYIKSIF
jgi:hypothetical protein